MPHRTFMADSPLGDRFQLFSLSGEDGISRRHEWRVRLACEIPCIRTNELLGREMNAEIDLASDRNVGGKRFPSGQMTLFTCAGLWRALRPRALQFGACAFETTPSQIGILSPLGQIHS